MGDKTGILWTDHTFNPWIGCTKVSPGCKNCYAARRDARHLHGPEDHWGLGAPRKTMSVEYWDACAATALRFTCRCAAMGSL